MASWTRERITTDIKRFRVTERGENVSPVVGFTPTHTTGAGTTYHQWNILDGASLTQDGGAYVMRDVGETRFVVRVNLDAPAPSGCVLGFVTTGSTAGSSHYTIVDTSPVSIPQGATSFDIRIDPAQAGKWYKEKLLKITLDQATCVNCTVDASHSEFRVWLRPSVAVPTVEWASASQSGAAGAQTLTVNLSAASLEDTKVYYNLGGTIDGADYSITSGDESGSLTISAGSTSGTLDFTIGGGATSSETLTFTLEHESNTVLHSDGLEEIHADENRMHSTDQWDLDVQAFGEGREWPADPTEWVTGGLDPSDSTDGAGSFLAPITQADVTDPAGEAIQGVVISQYHNANSSTGYLRNGFEDQTKCGGPASLHYLRRYIRVALRVDKYTSSENLWRNMRFVKLSMRNRSLDLNHYITVDMESTGVDKDGAATTTWSVDGSTWGLWDKGNHHPTATTFGVTEEVFSGEGATKSSGTTVQTIWMCHELDPSQPYTVKNQTVYESEGQLGNPILRPCHLASDDGTSDADGKPIASRGKGTIPFWPWLEMRSTSAYSGAPGKFWHKRGRWWEPRGSAALVDAGTNLHTFTVS